MNEFIHGNILPRIERLEAENKKLEMRFQCKPSFNIEIESTDVDKLISAMQKIYSSFAASNLTINATLKEATANGV